MTRYNIFESANARGKIFEKEAVVVIDLRSLIAPRVITYRRAYVEILLCIFFWGASFASMRIAVHELTPLLAVWLRIALGLPILTAAVVCRRELRMLRREEILPLLFLGFMGVVFHQDIQFFGMRTAGVANANWLIAGTPSVVALLGWFFLGEKLSRSAVAGLAISGLGVLLVVGLGTKGLGLFRMGAFGDLLIAISAVNWAVFQILSRRTVRDNPPTFTAFWINAFAVIIQTALLVVFPPDLHQLAEVSLRGWGALLFLGCVCSGLCYIFWYDGLSVMSAAKVTAFQFLQPLFGAVAAYFLAGERFTPFIFIGGSLIMIGVWLVNRRKLKGA